MNLNVRRARPDELDAIWALVQRAVERMHQRGNDQWGDQYPAREDFAEDIEQGELWCVADDSDAVLGVAAVICRHEPDYAGVPFRKPEPALSMHRVAVDPVQEGRGVGSALFEQFERLGRERGVEALRIDTYDLNDRMQFLIRKHGFDYVGDTHYPRRPLPYHCYEKILEDET